MVLLLVCRIRLVISIFIDIFRSDDPSGWGRAGRTTFVIVIPLIGVLVDLIARGVEILGRSIDQAPARQRAADDHIRQAAAPSSTDGE